MTGPFHHHAFGLVWRSEVPLPDFDKMPVSNPDILVETRDASPPAFAECDGWGNIRIGEDCFRYSSDEWTIDATKERIILYPRARPDAPLPVQFFSTVAAGVMALRGNIPIHGSAVAFGERGILVTGRGNAGKSSFAAMLMQLGGRLISDDLSVLARRGRGFVLLPGRPFIRLYPKVAAGIPATLRSATEDGKIRLELDARQRSGATSLDRFVCLDNDDAAPPAAMRSRMLLDMLFRTKGLRRLPGHGQRMTMLEEAAASVNFLRLRSLTDRDLSGASVRAATLVSNL